MGGGASKNRGSQSAPDKNKQNRSSRPTPQGENGAHPEEEPPWSPTEDAPTLGVRMGGSMRNAGGSMRRAGGSMLTRVASGISSIGADVIESIQDQMKNERLMLDTSVLSEGAVNRKYRTSNEMLGSGAFATVKICTLRAQPASRFAMKVCAVFVNPCGC